MPDADHLARDDGGPVRARGNGIGHHERPARAWFHCGIRRARLDSRGSTDGDPQRPPRQRASGSDRAQRSRCDDHQKCEPSRLLKIGPGRPIQHLDAATQKAILAAADSDFIEGIRFSLVTAMVLLSLVLAAGFVWFPRGKGSIADAERGAKALASEETARESHLSYD